MSSELAWRILVTDDDPVAARQVKEILEGEPVDSAGGRYEVHAETSFDGGLAELERSRFDLVILDVRLGEGGGDVEAGVRALAAIRERRFVPVVFYTAIPGAVAELVALPLIDVVEKSAGPSSLVAAVRRAFASGLPLVNRELIRHVEKIQRAYMWSFVADNWQALGAATDRGSLAYLLARRLAVSLSGTGVEGFAAALGGAGSGTAEGRFPPMRHYLFPPLAELLVGDLVQGAVADRDGFWVVLSPSCDLVQGKSDLILLAGADPLQDQPEANEWRRGLPDPGRDPAGALAALLANNRRKSQAERYHFLPGVLSLADLVVDFQQLQSVERGAFEALTRVASIDSPYAEAVVTRFVRYYSRLGTPDLDMADSFERLRALGNPGPA